MFFGFAGPLEFFALFLLLHLAVFLFQADLQPSASHNIWKNSVFGIVTARLVFFSVYFSNLFPYAYCNNFLWEPSGLKRSFESIHLHLRGRVSRKLRFYIDLTRVSIWNFIFMRPFSYFNLVNLLFYVLLCQLRLLTIKRYGKDAGANRKIVV